MLAQDQVGARKGSGLRAVEGLSDNQSNCLINDKGAFLEYHSPAAYWTNGQRALKRVSKYEAAAENATSFSDAKVNALPEKWLTTMSHCASVDIALRCPSVNTPGTRSGGVIRRIN